MKAKGGTFTNLKGSEGLCPTYIFLVMDLRISSRKMRVNTEKKKK